MRITTPVQQELQKERREKKNRKEGSHQINHRRKFPGAQTQVWDIPITEQKFPHLNIFLGNFETSGIKTSRGRKISTKELASPTLLDAGR